MCGIAGIYDLRGRSVAHQDLVRMTEAIAHRGPDGSGHYTDGPLGLGHRRLAIIDLTSAASQPMSNDSADMVLTYNGELYNFQSLRVELQALGFRFTSQSDTEVLLHALEAWGEKAVERFNGMFAFALWDRKRKRLLLARDRYGVKPLYYLHRDGQFIFGSEIKAILAHPRVSRAVCPAALSEYFTFQNVFTDLTLFDGVRMLPPGCTMTVDPASPTPVTHRRYWDYSFNHRRFDDSPEDTVDKLFHLFDRAVTRQLVADVPVGSYLSGGIDSGSITAVASRHIRRLHTFTGGFDLSSASGLEIAFDERQAAELMANQFKTEHYEMVMHAGDMEHVLPSLIRHLEDLRVGQCYPNYYLSRLASRFVKVVLSGTGGDELFAGYPWRYYRALQAKDHEDYYRSYFGYWQRLIPNADRSSFFSEAMWHEVAGLDPFDAFRSVFSTGDPPLSDIEDVVNASLYFEIRTFLHGLFVVEDKLSMAHSLETRVPFLDNDLVDYALRIPPRMKLRDLASAPVVDEDEAGKAVRYRHQATADGKLVLRQAMSRLIPQEIQSRAKQGFSAPDASWFRGESVEYINRLLRDPRARIHEFVQPRYTQRVLDEHTAGRVNHRLLIWSLLSFEWWLREFLP